jgi:hypothetical protein
MVDMELPMYIRIKNPWTYAYMKKMDTAEDA